VAYTNQFLILVSVSGTTLHTIPIPQCANSTFGTDAYFECMARHFTFTIYHQSGTCKMGPSTDRKAVVDPRLKVYGVKGLRVSSITVLSYFFFSHRLKWAIAQLDGIDGIFPVLLQKGQTEPLPFTIKAAGEEATGEEHGSPSSPKWGRGTPPSQSHSDQSVSHPSS